MIVTKTPLRISLGGGGTDLPAYYSRYGGEWVSAAINKYVYVCINPSEVYRFYHNGLVYKNKIVAEVKKEFDISDYEIISISDLPHGSGLGSSSSFTVGLIQSLIELKPEILAEVACDIEMKVSPVGKQDHYAAAYGGINHFQIDKEGEVTVTPVLFNHRLFNRKLMLLKLGIQREANEILSDQQDRIDTTANYLHKIRGLGVEVYEALQKNDFDTVGMVFNEHWKEKKKISSKMSTGVIDEYYSKALEAGALGGKVIGAGGGGFLLLYAPEDKQLQITESLGLEDIEFNFEFEGCTTFVIS